MMRKIFGFLGVCLWVGYTIIGIVGWHYMPTASKIIIVINAIILSIFLIIKLITMIHLMHAVLNVEKKHIENLERGLRKIHMYEYTRGKEYARDISDGQKILCDISILAVKHIRSQVSMTWTKKKLDNNIKRIEEIKNQMVVL